MLAVLDVRASSALVFRHVAVPAKNCETRNFWEPLFNKHPVKTNSISVRSKTLSMCFAVLVYVMQRHELTGRLSTASTVWSVMLKNFGSDFLVVFSISLASKFWIFLSSCCNVFRSSFQTQLAASLARNYFSSSMGKTNSSLPLFFILLFNLCSALWTNNLSVRRLATADAKASFFVPVILSTTCFHICSIA
jgi:hypothetical protein